MTHSSEAIVKTQAETYNAHNLEGFAATFAPDVELYQLPAMAPFMTGREALRQFYAENRFNLPTLRADVTNQMIFGNFVIYDENISGLAEDGVVRMIAIYHVESGLIRRVWFIR
ncbi:MAG: nuclear transport factor 2 family protein [Anaerolineae bacterium]|nr:nuclear transport factor 2 family protein [Anaerolineae bacterium]